MIRNSRKTLSLKAVRVATLILLAFWPVSGGTAAATSSETEYWLKAKFLVMSPSFVEWPLDAAVERQDVFSLCVYGIYPFGTTLASMAHSPSVRRQRIEVKWVQKDGDLRGCNTVFVSQSEKGRYSGVLEKLQGTSILTVGETSDFLDAGGMVNLEVQESRLQFDVNLGATEESRLKISSKLLAMARSVTGFAKPARN